jgi:hypothetical protein
MKRRFEPNNPEKYLRQKYLVSILAFFSCLARFFCSNQVIVTLLARFSVASCIAENGPPHLMKNFLTSARLNIYKSSAGITQ